MRVISVLDTVVTSYNLGNQIIMEAVYDVMNELFPDDFLYSLPWEGPVSKTAHGCMRASDYVFFGGTNSLSSHLLRYRQMCFRLRDLIRFDNLTLLGVGWWQYQGNPDIYTRAFLRRLLSAEGIHSVRDEYTKQKLSGIGIKNTANTCCPTTWGLTPAHLSKIPTKKSDNVIFTFTDYNSSRELDCQLFEVLADSYRKIYYWVQGVGDLKYIRSFKGFAEKVDIISPKLINFDQALDSLDCDYVGTRLHAGIRAIQRGKRALILAVDNRAVEIANDINLSVAPRKDISCITDFVFGEYRTQLNIPYDEINRWKAQFT